MNFIIQSPIQKLSHVLYIPQIFYAAMNGGVLIFTRILVFIPPNYFQRQTLLTSTFAAHITIRLLEKMSAASP
jgi:hypothetical protein